nr:hypothetical protein [Actinomadura rubteroloni]
MPEAGDGGHVGPGAPDEQVSDDLSVHPGSGGHTAQRRALFDDRGLQLSGNVLDSLRGDEFASRTAAQAGQVRLGPLIRVAGQIPRGPKGPSSRHRDVLLSVQVDRSADGCLTSHYKWSATLDPETSEKIDGYRPPDAGPEWEQVGDTAQAVVAAVAPMTDYDVELLLHATGKLAVWAMRRGIPCDPEVWLRHETIDEFMLTGCPDLAPGSVRTYRACLRQIRAGLTWAQRGESEPPPLRAPRRTTPPYEPGELAALRDWAAHLPRRARLDAQAMLAMAAGCGLAPGELTTVQGPHVQVLKQGTVKIVSPGLQRLVVARAGWEEQLAEAAATAGDHYLFRPGRKTVHSKNLIGSWCHRHNPTGDLPAMSARRLRTTWIVELLSARIDSEVVAKAAGVSTSALGRYQQFVPPLDEKTATRLLRGHR